MATTRVAFAGLSPLCERIVREALARDGRFEVVEPWTSLPALDLAAAHEAGDILFLELTQGHLPAAVRAMQAAARLRIVALSLDASRASVFELLEHEMAIPRCMAREICDAISHQASRSPAAGLNPRSTVDGS
jgi:hypothetical protein